MRKRMFFSFFHLWPMVLLLQCIALATPHDIKLPHSTITLPWSVFNQLSNRTPDTVFIPPETPPPTKITFGNMHLSVILHDSMAEMSLKIGYTVLASQGWAEASLFDRDFSGVLSLISIPNGDFLRSTDNGYILTADATNKKSSRQLSITYTVPAHSDAGAVSVQTSLPQAVRCLLDIIAPASFTEVTTHKAMLSGRQRIRNAVRYQFMMNTAEQSAVISYNVPIKKISGDTIASVESPSDTMVGEPVVTVQQESAVFPMKENAFIFTALRFTVVRAPITRFSIALPDSFSLLTLSGNGINTWKKTDHGRVLQINLGFALKGTYSLYIAGEQPADSHVVIPAITVREAAHQNGLFGLVIEKGSEALLLSATNCVDFSRTEFLRGLSHGFSDSIIRYGYSLQNMALAGKYFKIPFSASFLIRQHAPVPVADALCEVGSVRTVISKEAKLLTQANFLIRYRNRQFISLALPDSVSLWSVTLDGVRISPSINDSGGYKISLQRNYAVAETGRSSMLEVTYLQTMKSAVPTRSFHLQAPVIDIPVSTCEWTVFYPERWIVKNTNGTFTTAQTTLFGKRFYTLGSSEQQSLYRTLQESNTAQQTTAKAASALSLMPESPKYLYVHTILVVNEQPWLEIKFGSYAVHRIITLLFILCGIGVVLTGVIIGRRIKWKTTC